MAKKKEDLLRQLAKDTFTSLPEQETESSLATAVQKLDEMRHNGSLWKMISRHIRPLRT